MTADERDAIERFPLVAYEFCRLIDQFGKHDRMLFVQALAVHLARLCEVAARLPWVEPVTADIENTPEAVAAHSKEWAEISNNLRQIFGSLDSYWEIFDPTHEEEPVSCSLANDLSEIYLDLKDAQNLLKSGAALEDIHWEWRFDFRSHWSRHASSALRVLLHISDLA